MDLENYLEQLDENARHSLKFEQDYHRAPYDPLEYSYGMTPPFEYYHEEALMRCIDEVERFVKNHPDKEKLEKKLYGYKSKVAAYERLHRKELRKPDKGDYGTFSKKYPPPYQKALTVYLEKSEDIKREMGLSVKVHVSQKMEKEKTVEKCSRSDKLPACLKDWKRYQGNKKSEKVRDKEFERER